MTKTLPTKQRLRRGRPLEWPEAWKELCGLLGGPASFKEAMGYSSPNSLPDKIHGRNPWSRADKKLLAYICASRGFDYQRLVL